MLLSDRETAGSAASTRLPSRQTLDGKPGVVSGGRRVMNSCKYDAIWWIECAHRPSFTHT